MRLATCMLFALLLTVSFTRADAPALTKAQRARSGMSQQELRALRHEISKMRSSNRWPKKQQERYLANCARQKAQEPSINHRLCECTMEVMMEKYSTFGEYAKYLVDNGGPQDEQVTGMTGMCLAAYGT